MTSDLDTADQPHTVQLDVRPARKPRRGAAVRTARTALLVLLALVPVALDLHLPVVRPVLALVALVGVPTLVLHRRAGFPADSAVGRFLYAFGTSLLGLVLAGLVVNTVLPFAGIDRPLTPPVLATTCLVLDLGLLAWRPSVPLLTTHEPGPALRRVLAARLEPAQALAVVAVVLAVLGAVRLNNGAGGAVALVAEALAAAALLVLLLRPGGLGRDTRTLALVAAGLLLATSLRGWYITGHDIQAEFLAFRLTDDAQHWQMSALPSAYNACLSVNILPTVLAQATGLSGEVVFKLLLQLVFAAVPVLTFLLSRRFVSHRLALAAATFTLAFPTFYTDMPYLVRQEIAFFFLGLLLLAATEPDRSRTRTRALVVLFGIGVVLSHYSTTYVLLMAVFWALLGMALAPLVRRVLRRPKDRPAGAPLMLLHPLVVAILVAVTLAWAGPITHTGGHATSVARETLAALTGNVDDGPSSSDTSYWLFSSDQTTPRERMNMFTRATMDYRNSEIPRDERVVRHPGRAELHPRLQPLQTAPLTPVGRVVDSVGPSPVHVDNAAKLGCAVLMQVFALVGVVWLLRRGRRRARVDDVGEPEQRPSRELVLLTMGALTALAMIVLIPNLSVDYGVLRAFQQTLLVIAPLMAMGMWTLLRPLASRRAGAAAVTAAVVPVGLLLVLTGVLPAVLGGQEERMALANAGTYYDRFFATDSEIQALSFLGRVDHADRSNERVIADRNVNVRLLASSDNRAPVSDRLYPTLLSRDAYVFVDGQILDQGVSTIFYTGDLLTYAYPLGDLDRHLDLVYSAPQARIYR